MVGPAEWSNPLSNMTLSTEDSVPLWLYEDSLDVEHSGVSQHDVYQSQGLRYGERLVIRKIPGARFG